MGLTVAAYLFIKRKERIFPRFVILQLVLIVSEYTFATAVNSWELVHLKRELYDDKDYLVSEKVYLNVTYPMNTLMRLLFENYNWCYVYHYLKVA